MYIERKYCLMWRNVYICIKPSHRHIVIVRFVKLCLYFNMGDIFYTITGITRSVILNPKYD